MRQIDPSNLCARTIADVKNAGGIESEIPWSAKRRRIPNTVAGCGCDDAGSGVDSPHAMLIRFCDVDISLHVGRYTPWIDVSRHRRTAIAVALNTTRKEEDNEEALRLLYRAVEIDRRYAAAYALAGYCYTRQYAQRWISPSDPAVAEGVRMAWLAAEHGQDDPEALWMAGVGRPPGSAVPRCQLEIVPPGGIEPPTHGLGNGVPALSDPVRPPGRNRDRELVVQVIGQN